LDYKILYPHDSSEYLEIHKPSRAEVITKKDLLLANHCLSDYHESSLSHLIGSKDPEFYGKYSLSGTDNIKLYFFMPPDVDDIAFFYTINNQKIFQKGILSAWSVDYYKWKKSTKEK
jgi:hypothetical protein